MARTSSRSLEKNVASASATSTTAASAFVDRTIEAEEHCEEAAINKEARVVGEIELRKTATEREETMSDTVRKTEVEVEDNRDLEQKRFLRDQRLLPTDASAATEGSAANTVSHRQSRRLIIDGLLHRCRPDIWEFPSLRCAQFDQDA